MRVILEAALDLEVRADLEIEHVAEIATLAAAIEAKDRDTRGHTARVAELTVTSLAGPVYRLEAASR